MSPSDHYPKIALSLGDPAGIGADVAISNCTTGNEAALIHFTDPRLIEKRAEQLGLRVDVVEVTDIENLSVSKPGVLQVYPIPNRHPVQTGVGNPDNAEYILECLDSALWHTATGITNALVTGPINKGIINEAGIEFTGHTEYLANSLNIKTPVMMLASDELKVVLMTTHVPIEVVTQLITPERVLEVIKTLNNSLINLFKIPKPKICVCGLNPHAGEGGYLGSTDKEVISPTINQLVDLGLNVVGPIPADSAFSELERTKYHSIVAMYHDQGLAPLKAVSFGNAVNITLGLPIIRTSVDHGTAYDIAGTGKADSSSFKEAIKYATLLAMNPKK